MSSTHRVNANRVWEQARQKVRAWVEADVQGRFAPLVDDAERAAREACEAAMFAEYRAIRQDEGAALAAAAAGWWGDW